MSAEVGGPAVVLLGAPVPPPYGGIATYLQRAIPSLLARGYRIHAVRPQASASSAGGSERLTLDHLRWPGPAGAAAFVLRRLPGLLPFLLRFLPSIARHPRFALREAYGFVAWCLAAERACRAARPAIVHAYDYPWSQGAAALWAARRFGARCLVSTFGEVVPHRDELRQHDEVSAPFRALSRYVLAAADGVASMTEHCRRQVRYVGIDPTRVALVRFVVGMEPYHPGVDGSAVRARLARDGGPLLLFVGQVRARKGPQTLVEALPGVLAAEPRARLVVVGPDHGYGAELRALAEGLGVAHAIDWVGAVSDTELPDYYAACDAFLFPTLTQIECLGLTFVQAMFAGRPVIATAIAGAPEVIRDGIDGRLVPPGDAGAFARACAELLAMPAPARAAMGRAARERALALFDEAEVLSDVEGFYARALGRRAGAPAPAPAAAGTA